jgi:putative sterol carrier protein
MDDALAKALAALQAKLGGQTLDASVKFVFTGLGAIRLDDRGARADDGTDADCTISASPETFKSLFDGDTSPTGAFMTGKLRIEGDMGVAMRAASLIA